MQKKSWAGSAAEFFRHLFKLRNIIIISDHKIEHYPIGARLQLAGLMAVIAGICWISYSTGSYMAAKSVLKEKDHKIYLSALEKRKIGHEFSMLKRDLVKLNTSENPEISDYAKFILDQYKEDDSNLDEQIALSQEDMDEIPQESEKVLERITFLEKRIEDLKNTNTQMVAAIREKTKGKIGDLEQIISMTGLNKDKITRQAMLLKKPEKKAKPFSFFPGQGGPYIPTDSTELGMEGKQMFKDIDQLMLLQDTVEKLPLGEPVRHYQSMSGFGKRVDPFTRRWATHTGLDMAGAPGAKIFSVNDGVVKFAGRNGAYGIMVDVEHGMGLTTRYGHLSRALVQEGQKVRKGHIIGIQGSTGRSTGPHLHYEVRYNDRPLNPHKFIQAGKHVFKE